MKVRSSAAMAAVAGVSVMALCAVVLPLQAAQGAPSVPKGKPTPSPSPSTPGIYFQTAGSAQLSSGPTIAVQAPLTSQGVAAGNYRVDATVVVSDPTDGNASTVTCYLQMGGVNSPISQQSIPDGITASGSLATIPLLYVYSGVPTGAHVSVTCSSTGQGSAATVLSATLIAEPVGSIG